MRDSFVLHEDGLAHAGPDHVERSAWGSRSRMPQRILPVVREVARLMNELVGAGVIQKYALFGAAAQMRNTEPIATLDAWKGFAARFLSV